MPRKVPSARPEDVARALQACGLKIQRQTGSHLILNRPGLRRPVVVAMHKRELPSRTILKIVQQADLNLDEFLDKL